MTNAAPCPPVDLFEETPDHLAAMDFFGIAQIYSFGVRRNHMVAFENPNSLATFIIYDPNCTDNRNWRFTG